MHVRIHKEIKEFAIRRIPYKINLQTNALATENKVKPKEMERNIAELK